MKSDLPLVAIVADDPRTAATISLIVNDLCRIHFCRAVEDVGATGEYPRLILNAVHVPGIERCGPGPRPTATPTVVDSPFVYLALAETRTGNDGAVLRDCFATTHQPAQFRAMVEARLGIPAKTSVH